MAQNQVLPTKAALLSSKKSLGLAKTGYELMDRKRNILIKEAMALIEDAKRLQSEILCTYVAAYKALQDANVTLGVVDDLARAVPIEDGLQINFRSVMGVEIPKISFTARTRTNYFGYDQTNSLLDEAYTKFDEVKALTIRFCEVENTVLRLCHGIKQTQKRANALKHVIIPRFEMTVKQISSALEEKEREEFSRMKVIKK